MERQGQGTDLGSAEETEAGGGSPGAWAHGDASEPRPQLEGRQQSNPVTATWAGLKGSAAGTEAFRNGEQNNLERPQGPGGCSGGDKVASQGERAPRAKGLRRWVRAARDPGQSAAGTRAEMRGPRRAAPNRQRPDNAYLRRPPGSPPLRSCPRRRPPTLGGLRGSRSPAPQPPASPTSAARARSVSATSRRRLRKQPKAARARRLRAENSRGSLGPEEAARRPREERTGPDAAPGVWPAEAGDADARRATGCL